MEISQERLASELSRLSSIRAQFSFHVADRQDELVREERLREIYESAGLLEVFFTPYFTSHRKFLGPIVVFLKTSAVRLLNKFLRLSLVRQTEFNQKSWNAICRLHQLEQRVIELEKKVARGEG